MEHRPKQRRLASYLAQVTAGLIPFAVLAVTLNAYVAAEAIVAAVIVAVSAIGNLLLRNEL
jgi:hypothetical protein